MSTKPTSPFRFVRVHKLADVGSAPGKFNDLSSHVHDRKARRHRLPVGYWIEGIMIEEPIVGGVVTVMRTDRDRRFIQGNFRSSRVTAVASTGEFHTKHAKYRIESAAGYDQLHPAAFQWLHAEV